MKVDGVREMSRSATGVRLIDLDEDDEVIAAAKI
jgi:DNA gyrase/topoisomerase IV subunit A